MNLTAISAALSKALAIGQAIVALYPLILSAVDMAEQAFGAGNGAAKFEVVKSTLAAAYALEQKAVATWDDIAPALTSVINTIVASYKSIKGIGNSGNTVSPTVAGSIGN